MLKGKQFLMYRGRIGRSEKASFSGRMVNMRTGCREKAPLAAETPLRRFDPQVHAPRTRQDQEKMEQALWEGWELLVDEDTGEVWIGCREEKVALVDVT